MILVDCWILLMGTPERTCPRHRPGECDHLRHLAPKMECFDPQLYTHPSIIGVYRRAGVKISRHVTSLPSTSADSQRGGNSPDTVPETDIVVCKLNS